MIEYLTWEGCNIKWGEVDMVWEEVIVVSIVAQAIGGNWELPLTNTWREAKKQIPKEIQKKFLNIIVKVNDLTYKNSREITKRKKIKLDHIQNTFNKAGINIKVEVKKPVNKDNIKIDFNTDGKNS